jgi:hypothetical protein
MCRWLAYLMIDVDVVYVTPASVYRLLLAAGNAS